MYIFTFYVFTQSFVKKRFFLCGLCKKDKTHATKKAYFSIKFY
jgi:hypothetical protein